MRLLITVTVLAILLMVVAPGVMEAALDFILGVVLLLIYLLVIALAFSIASLVFFALCMRFTITSESLDDPYANHRVLGVIWTRWG